MAASLQEMTDRSGDITLNPDPKRYGEEPMSAARFKKELGELMDAIAGKSEPSEARQPRAQAGQLGNGKAEVKDAAAGALPTSDLRPPTSPVRFVLLSPIRHEDLRAVKPGLPDPAEHNKLLEQYSKAIEELANERGGRFVDLFEKGELHAAAVESRRQGMPGLVRIDGRPDMPHVTDNGVHLYEFGYMLLTDAVEKELAWTPLRPFASNTFAGRDKDPDQRLPINAAVVHKNELFFHQFRPANSTYLFGFRKHEQGQNAKEMPMFDPLIAAAEAEIDRLKKEGATAAPETPKSAASTPIKGEAPPLPDFTVEDGYQIELWAQNPYLEKPTQMNWDPQGRLWVCSSSLYPQIEPGQPANDKILILSDTDGDGKADKSEVFADGLLIPTGVAPDIFTAEAQRRGGKEEKAASDPSASASPRLSASAVQFGCYVGQSTELLYFRDTDGDGKADEKRIVFSGFGTEDTHHIVHTLHWGPDGRLYFHQSVYIHTHMETPWGMVRLNSGGVFAYDPRTERVEVFAKGLWNTWGQQEDDWGQTFLTDGAGRDGISWAFPGATFAPFEGSRRQMPSVSPGSYPKFCGLEIVKSPHFPAEWQGQMITCDFRAHRIVRFAIEDLAKGEGRKAKGESSEPSAAQPPISPSPLALSPSPSLRSGYVTTEQPDLIRTTDLSFRPIDVRLGPDGALYVADWSNPVINHGEVDFRDPRRDHHMGRIWRITKKGAPPVKWEPLLGKKNEELLDKLLSQSAWEKEQARRVTSAAIQNNSREYVQWSHQDPVTTNSDSPRGLEGSLLKARVGFREDNYAPQQAMAKQARLRALAARMFGEGTFLQGQRSGFREDTTAMRWLQQLGGDPNPSVRLEAMRGLARVPLARSASIVLDSALKTPENDPHYDFAAWQSINDLAKPWTDALASGAYQTEGREAQLAYGLKAIDPTLAGAAFSKLFAAGKVPLDGTWIDLIGDVGGPVELQRLLDGVLAGFVGDCCETVDTKGLDHNLAFTTPVAERAMAALQTAARVRNARPAAHADSVTALFKSSDTIVAGAIRLAGLWKAKDAVEKIGELLDTSSTPPGLRRAAVDGLRAAGGPNALGFLRTLTRPTEALDTRATALVATAQVKLDAGLVLAAEVLPTFTDEATLLGTWRGLLGVKGAADAFAEKFGKQEAAKSLPPPVLAAAVRAAREAGKPAAKLVAALTPFTGGAGGGAVSRDYTGLAAQAKENGDPAKGELVYRRATSACVTCHAIGGAGGKVGPDMTSIGASAPLDYIIESILDPAAKVKEGYNAVVLALLDGEQVTGIQSRETAAEVFLRDAAGAEKSVPKAQIKGKTDIGSMMPPGLTATMQPREALDMYAFLAQLGKPGAYDASKGTVARVWRLYPTAAAGEVVSPTYDPAKNPGFAGYTLVDGRFVKDLLTDAATIAAAGSDTVLLATQFQSSGKTRLKLTGAATAWLDGQPLNLATEVAPDLANGTHTLVVKIAVKELPEVLRAESPDARFLGN